MSGLSNDMRKLLEAEAAGNERARLAVDMFCYRLRKYIASYVGALGGLDALVFTGGIGENAAAVRERSVEGLAAMGVSIDPAANAAGPRAGSRRSAAGPGLPGAGGPDQRGAPDRARHVPDRARTAARMRKDGARTARRALLALLVVVSGAVAWSLRRPASRATAPSPRRRLVPGQGTTVADGSLMRFREGNRKVEVKWRSMVGREGAAMRLRGVEATFPFLRDGRASTATITADECLYQPQPQEASFRGNVHVRTDDGLELDTDRLDYKADEGVARTDDAVRFRRGASSGSARGLDYRSEGGSST